MEVELLLQIQKKYQKCPFCGSNYSKEKDVFSIHEDGIFERKCMCGLDTETSYILNLTTKENYEIANAYLKATCFENYIPIPDSYVGEKLIIEYTTNGGSHGNWYCIHGNIDQYFNAARATLERYMKKF